MRVVIESPYRAVDKSTQKLYTAYARRAVHDSIMRGESPVAFHLWFTRFLDDGLNDERTLGIRLSTEWIDTAERIAVYADHGVSEGMFSGIQHAAQRGIPVEWRYLYKQPKTNRSQSK